MNPNRRDVLKAMVLAPVVGVVIAAKATPASDTTVVFWMEPSPKTKVRYESFGYPVQSRLPDGQVIEKTDYTFLICVSKPNGDMHQLLGAETIRGRLWLKLGRRDQDVYAGYDVENIRVTAAYCKEAMRELNGSGFDGL